VKTKTRNNKRTLVITVSATLLSIGLACIATYYISSSNKTATQPTHTQIEERPVGDINYSAPTEDEQNPTLDPQQNPEVQDATIGVSITYADGSPLQVRVLIDEILSIGTCTAVITKDSKVVTSQTVEVFAAANSTTCKGFTIDSPTLAKGTYNVEVTVESGTKKGVASKEVVVK
jgi:hypothetical protein